MSSDLLVVYILILVIGHYYVRCQNFTLLPATSWQDARIGCRCNGTDLVMIKDYATWTAVSNFISTYYPTLSEFWFGLQWDPENHTFYWVDGEELGPYYTWDDIRSNEPNCMTNAEITHPVCPTNYDQDCVRMRNSLWRTHSCHNKYHAICDHVDHELPLSCHEATTNTTDPNNTSNSSPIQSSIVYSTKTSNSSATNKSTIDPTQTSNSRTIPTSATDWTHYTEMSKTTEEACVLVCPDDPITTTSRMADRNTTVPTTEHFKVNKKKTGAYIRAHTSAYDGRLSSKVIGLTGAAVICFVVLIMILIDATRITGNGSMRKSRRKSSRRRS